VPGCGHWVQAEAAAEVNDAVVDFLAHGRRPLPAV
jgi:pimeloyl-ACP methyl ester carboxylesterase